MSLINTLLRPTVLQRLAAVGLAVGGAMLTAGDWAELLTPQGVGGLLVAAAGAVLGIYGRQPRHAQRPEERGASGPWYV